MKKSYITLFLSLPLLLSSCGEQHYSEDKYLLSLDFGAQSTFNILTLSDLHFSQSDDLAYQFAFVDKSIQIGIDNNVGLIVLNGDIFNYATKDVVKSVFSHIDSFNIPWTFVFGNHDDQGYYNDTYIQNEIMNYKNSKFINLNDDISGRSNFVINLTKDNNVVHQVYLFDSHSYKYVGYQGYDYIKQSQIDWYKNMITYSNRLYKDTNWKVGDEVINSTMFFHIPLPEYGTAIQLYNEGSSEVEYLGGQNKEKSGGWPNYNSGLFDVMLEYNSTKTVIAAHDHINNLILKYKGVVLAYDTKSDDRVYYNEDMLGCTIVSVHDDSKVDVNHVYTKYGENNNEK